MEVGGRLPTGGGRRAGMGLRSAWSSHCRGAREGGKYELFVVRW